MRLTRRILRPWLCLAALFASQIALVVVVVVFLGLFPRFKYWVNNPFGAFFITAAGGLAAFLVVVAFARPKSLVDFLNLFEFASIRQGISYYALVAGVVLGLAGFLFTRIGGAVPAETYLTKPFVYQPGPEKHLLTILLLVGPLFEEITMRGFLYRAFRDRYGIAFSMLTVAMAATITHVGVATASLPIFLLLAVLQAILCLLLEMTRNLWNCIVCHTFYNATLISAWLIGARPEMHFH
jgi:membrane protease YdiL (CAAX protease family)